MNTPLTPSAGTQPPRCLATLVPLPVEGLSRAAQWELAGGRHRLPATINLVREAINEHQRTAMQHMSISGMQDKIAVRLHRGVVSPVDTGGTHILKPVPATALTRAADVPANEALTMLLARQVGLRTAACGLVRLADGELAYITRRFDRQPDGGRILQEDFGALSGMSEASHGRSWKYDSTYEALGRLVGQHCSARARDLEEFLNRVVFCFVIGNGDAHIRNFSVLRDRDGFVQLSPAYDLLCTRVHLPNDADLGLGVLAEEADARYSLAYERLGYYSSSDFLALGNRIGVPDTIAHATLQRYHDPSFLSVLISLVERSFLSSEAQASYVATVQDRLRKLGAGSTP